MRYDQPQSLRIGHRGTGRGLNWESSLGCFLGFFFVWAGLGWIAVVCLISLAAFALLLPPHRCPDHHFVLSVLFAFLHRSALEGEKKGRRGWPQLHWRRRFCSRLSRLTSNLFFPSSFVVAILFSASFFIFIFIFVWAELLSVSIGA